MTGVVLYDFIHKCNKANLTPSELEIDYYLMSINKINMRNDLIKFCFYHWNRRHDTKFIDNLLKILENDK